MRFEADFPGDSGRIFSGISGKLVSKPGKRVWKATIPANDAVRLSYRVDEREE